MSLTIPCDPMSQTIRITGYEYKHFLKLADMAKENGARFAAPVFAISARTGYEPNERTDCF